jgi:hypothetical protein
VRAHQRLEERVGNQVDVEALEVEEQLLKWPRPEDAASD